MNPRSIVEYIYENNNDDECKLLYDSLPEDFQRVLDGSADDWIIEIQKQNEEVLKQIDDVQKQREEVQTQIIECRQRTKITEALNEEVLRQIELNRIEMHQLGLGK